MRRFEDHHHGQQVLYDRHRDGVSQPALRCEPRGDISAEHQRRHRVKRLAQHPADVRVERGLSGKVRENNRNVRHRSGISIANTTAVIATIPAKTARMLRTAVQSLCIRVSQFSITELSLPTFKIMPVEGVQNSPVPPRPRVIDYRVTELAPCSWGM